MKFDLIIIGSGPAGYVAAIKASKLGMKVALIEKESLGGVCLNWGCIPTKSLLKSVEVFNYLLHSMEYGIYSDNVKIDYNKIINRSRVIASKMNKGVNYLMQKNKIKVISGKATLEQDMSILVNNINNNEINSYRASNIIIATGSSSKDIPGLPQNGKNIIGYREALILKNLPKNIIIVGGGAIGVEFAYFYNSMGAQVTIIEYKPQILPNEDKDISNHLANNFIKTGINIIVSSYIEKIEFNNGVNVVYVKNKNQEQVILTSDIIFSAVGVTPNIYNMGLDKIGINVKNGYIVVDEFYNTNKPGYYAIGDVIPTPSLAHLASAEAISCVNYIYFGKNTNNLDKVDYNNVPSCVYCKPEISSVGLTESKAIELGYDIKIGKFPFMYSGKANANNSTDGFIKVIFDANNGEWLGCHMIGDNVTEIIAEVVVARKLETTAQEIMNSIHPHPTISEVLMEAVCDAYGESINNI